MKKLLLLCAIFLIGSMFLAEALDVSVSDYDPRPAKAGKAVNVWFKVENTGPEAETDLFLEIVPKDGLELTSGETSKKRVGVLASSQSHIVQFRLFVKDDAFKGGHEIEANLFKGDSASQTADISIEITDKDFKEVNLEVGDVDSDPARIKPDDEDVKLEVTIQNIGDGKAQGVKAELTDLPKGVTLSESYSGSSLSGNIEADSTSKATFFIDIDKTVDPKEYESNILVSYKYKPDEEEDEYSYEENKIPLKVAIKPVPIYNITEIRLNKPELRAGDKDIKLRLNIENIGKEKGESVRIKAYGKIEQPISFDKSSDFIAPTLEPGEIGQGTLEFKIDDDANLQKYYLDIEIKSVVNDDVITYNMKVPVIVSKPKPNNPTGIVSIGVILIVGFIWFRRFRKRRKEKENLKEAVAGETHEFKEMYPKMIEEAEKEGNTAAKISFSGANAAEQIHAEMYQHALESVEAGKDLKEKDIYVCQVCGHTVEDEAPDECPICKAKKQAFKKIE